MGDGLDVSHGPFQLQNSMIPHLLLLIKVSGLLSLMPFENKPEQILCTFHNAFGKILFDLIFFLNLTVNKSMLKAYSSGSLN